MIFIVFTGVIVGCYLAWSMLAAADKPVPHMSDDESLDVVYDDE